MLNTVYRIFWPSLCVCVCASAKALSFSVGHQVQGSLRSLLALSISLLFAAYDHLSSLQFPSFVLFVFSVCLCRKNEEKPFATSVAKIFAQATVGNSSRINKSAHLLLLIKTFMGTHTQMSCTHTHTLKTRTHTLTNFLINMSKADAGGPTTTTAVTAPLQCCKCKQNTTKC